MVNAFWCGKREEGVEQAELADDLEGGRVDGVAAEIAQEIGMLLEHDHVDAGAREQEAEHEPAGRRRRCSNA